jgi:cytochrome c1
MGRTVDANGQPLTRPGIAADYFPPPFPNEKAARMANNGALPPDLSLIVKAREGHEDYVYSILTGFGLQQPANERMPPGLYYNPYFPRHLIAMPPPLTNGSVTFADGTPNTVDQEARAVVTFLSWAAEPKMEERKRTGFNVLLFLIGFGVLVFFTYRRIWHGHHDVGPTGEGLE